MSGKKGSPEKQRSAAKRTSDKSEESSATPTQQQSPAQRNQCRPKRRRHNRASSSSSDGVVLEARRDMRHMERLLLHSGKLHVFRAFFDDPTLEFYTRPDGRRRHPAGARNRRPPDEDRALAVLGIIGDQEPPVDNDPLVQRPPAVQEEDVEGPPSVVSSRGVSSMSSFVNCDQSPPDSSMSDFEMVPFEGLPSVGSSPEGAAAARPSRPEHASSSSAAGRDDCDYLASVSASDSDESARTNLFAFQMTAKLDRMSMSVDNPPPLPEPEPMSLSSDPEETP